MKIFLNGGGDGIQVKEVYKRLNKEIDNNKPVLYIPLAMDDYKYDDCYNWITNELREIDVPYIEMIRSSKELSEKNLNNYSLLFFGGGNTFKLLHELKQNGIFDKITDYINNNGVIFGGSAGAIIFGNNLKSCMLDDDNIVDLKDISGFDALNYISILCHYTNRTKEKDEQSKQYLLKISKGTKIFALPEEITLYINDGTIEAIGDKPYYLFEDGNIIGFNNNIDKKTNLKKIKTPEQIIDFMDTNITYGWTDVFGKKHLNNLKNFRKLYKTNTLEDILNTGYGTCIEQAKLMNHILKILGYETKLFFHRSYETEENYDKEVKIHIIVLFENNGYWYHIEHANMPHKGIHKYESIENAIKEITKGFDEHGDIRKLTEISEIPDNLSFKEFNDYVNSYDKIYKK